MIPIDSALHGDVIIYQSGEENISTNVLFKDETFWMTQKDMATLFCVDISTINYHLKEIFDSEELSEESTIGKFPIVRLEGTRKVTRTITFYNLDAIIAVGYRVNSKEATQFRIWATKVLREYIVKGFALNDDMLKNGTPFGQNYFKELLRRVQSIRASERQIYQQITDIFAECSVDYDVQDPFTRQFYAMVQNKFHYAITGKTAAEIIYNAVDRDKPHMGLQTWKSSPHGRIHKSDVTIAKNYLTADEIRKLERTVSSFFDYIEGIIERKHTFTMKAFAESVDKFLSFNEYEVLTNKGHISKLQADKKAVTEYKEFNRTQKVFSDFDRIIHKQNE
ncbi:virulence RhuM family protein [Veillonella sp. VA139]|uniref:virulence RhuM family protein n=1 Tax=Veillonella sp. VA139 TaxID=741830 RepID=UPI000F8C5C5C|nr:virulence RhuM family protein [Veillonella sp. VA139]